MKIGVITDWTSQNNYGQIMQCWALQYVLKKLNHEPYLIRFLRFDWTKVSPRKYSTYEIILRFVKQFIKLILVYPALKTYKRKKRIRQNIEIERQKNEYLYKMDKERKFSDFIIKHIKLSSIIYPNYENLLINPPSADAYVTGSDQVWNYDIHFSETQAFFLQFGESTVKRIAYAPSIGHDSWPEERKEELIHYLSTFDAISLREQSGVNICKQVGFNATHVLDPTMLLTKDDYSILLKETENMNIDMSNHYIYIYSLNYLSAQDIDFENIKNYAKEKHLDIKVTPSTGYNIGSELFDDVEYVYATIPQWIQYIAASELVVTASFHGIVFSILYHKNFIFTPLKGEYSHGNARVLELLQNLGLQNFIEDSNKGIQEYIMYKVDWDIVDEKLKKMRKSSYSFLINALKK